MVLILLYQNGLGVFEKLTWDWNRVILKDMRTFNEDTRFLKAGIYKIVNTINGKIYVGSTNCFKNRYRSHLNNLKRNTHYNEYLQKSFNKHGIDVFIFEIIEVVADKNLLTIREQHYMELTKCCDKSFGFNIAPRADRPGELSEESRKKISDFRKANPFTKEQIEKSRTSRTGVKLLEEHKNNIRLSVVKRFKEMTEEDKIKISETMRNVFDTPEHKGRLQAQSEKINLKRMKIQDEFTLSEIVVKYVACKSLVSTAAEFNMSKSALSRIFKKTNNEYPILYRDLLIKIGFDGCSITDLHKAEIQSKLTLYKRIKNG